MNDIEKKYYVRISLISNAKEITDMERKNLIRCKKWIDRGDDFRVAINSMNLGFEELEKERLQRKLSQPVKSLFESLKISYGSPEKTTLKIGGGAFPLIFP